MNILNKSLPAKPVELLNTDLGEIMEAKAIAFAATQTELGTIINTIAKAKQDWQGGPFQVLFKVSASMTDEQQKELPNPGSETGNNPAIYKIKVDGTGKSKKQRLVEHNYYNVVSDNLPCNLLKSARIRMLELSLGDPTLVNMEAIPQDIKDMPKDRRAAEISRFGGELLSSRRAVNEAFELYFQTLAIKDLTGVDCNVIYALDEQGKELNGEDGREVQVENTLTPIVVTTKVEGRKAIDTIQLSVASFKRLRPEVAKERGGTYSALMDSAPKKGTNKDNSNSQDQSKPQAINTLETFEARLTDLHDYLDTIYSDSKQEMYGVLIKKMNAKTGNENLLTSMTEVRDIINDVLAKTFKQAERYQAIITAEAAA